jgi:tetratricopeptide (TPR) repeat protein
MGDDQDAGTRNAVSGGTQNGPVLQARTINARFEAASPAPVALAQLPPPVAGFTGRDDDLAVITGLLDPTRPSGTVVVSAVAGLAGVGKTTLAVQAGHVVQERGWYQGGVLFIDLHGYDEAPAQPAQALDALLRALGIPGERIPPSGEERAGLYRSALAQISEPVLVIADNASSEAQVRPLLPGVRPHRVIVTSRHTLAGLDARLLDLRVLDEAAGLELLDRALRAARPDDERVGSDREAAERLARICGGLPLALQIVAASLKADPGLRVSELADDLAVERERLGRLRYDDGSGTAAPSVAAAFEHSYQRLDELAARTLRLLPVNPGPEVSTAAVAILADLPVGKAREVLAGLARAHLIEAAPGAAGRWRMHDLMRLYTQRLSDEHAHADSREEARDRLLAFYDNMADDADRHLRALPGEEVPASLSSRADALAWLDAERLNLVAAVTMAADSGRDQIAFFLPNSLAEYLDLRRRFDDKLATTAISLETARRLGDRPNEGIALSILGSALKLVGRHEEAITASQDAAAIFREIHDRHGEGMVMGNLGTALLKAGRLEEAITASQDAAAIFHEIRDRPREGWAMGNLCDALREAGRLEEAISVGQDAAAIARETGDRQAEGLARGNLGIALREAGRFEEAITASQDAAAIFHETDDGWGESQTAIDLADALAEAGRLEEALTASQDALAIARKIGAQDLEDLALQKIESIRAAQQA